MKTVAVILAREGSKGVPLKNLRKVGNHSLLARTIIAAEESNIFDTIIVSTDGELIAKEAAQFSSVIVVNRPKLLASDSASSISGVLHALKSLNILVGISCLLQPTSPFRGAKHITEAYHQFLHAEYRGCVFSGCQVKSHPYKALVKLQNTFLPVHEMQDLESPRQNLPIAYRPNGAIYFNKVEDLLSSNSFFIEPISLYEMNEADSLDIDTEADLTIANTMLGDEL